MSSLVSCSTGWIGDMFLQFCCGQGEKGRGGREMFFGQWEIKIDDKWRLAIPSAVREYFNDFLFLKEGMDGCLEIYSLLDLDYLDPSFLFKERIKKNRIKIPAPLRKSISFYFGKKITLVGRGYSLELWPRP